MNKKGKWLVFGLLTFLAAVTGSGQGQTTEAAAWPAPIGNGNALYMAGISARLPTESASIQTAGNYYTRLKAAQYTQGARGKPVYCC
ncbi:MAG TPA: hypothetical protein VHK27_02785 [Gammaproteobacteria bacterium]|nr:hypothetical protein [Gammaproteobacteria bacterium]